MNNLRLISILLVSTFNASEEVPKDQKEARNDFSIIFLANTITEDGTTPRVEVWECGHSIQAIDQAMFLTVIFKSDMAIKEGWGPRQFDSNTHFLYFTKPPNPKLYYQVALTPKDGKTGWIWPYQYLVNKTMFDKLSEVFTIRQLPPQRFKIELFPIPVPKRPVPQLKNDKVAVFF